MSLGFAYMATIVVFQYTEGRANDLRNAVYNQNMLIVVSQLWYRAALIWKIEQNW